MSSIQLTPVSYLVLGLVARAGEATPYDLKGLVSRSIGFFWSFPHSQLYAEPERLARAGLLREARERHGRRRRVYSITDSGLDALREWLRAPVEQPIQVRDLGLLKLFFGEFVEPDAVVALARAQTEFHRARLAAYEQVEERLSKRVALEHPYATLRLGLRMERALAEFWADVAAHPPRTRRVDDALPTPLDAVGRRAARAESGTSAPRRRS